MTLIPWQKPEFDMFLDRPRPQWCFLNSFVDGPLLASQITTGTHILALVNVVGPGDRNPKLKIYVLERILDINIHIAVAYVTMFCVI
jgi:hypothetical protein